MGPTRPRLVLMACGSYSPPTPMHLRMFELARDYFHSMNSYSVVGGIISPVHDSYGKKDLVPAHHRMAMLDMSLRSSNWIKVSEWEINQEGWTRTRLSLKYHQNAINNYINSLKNGNVCEPPPKWMPNDVFNASLNSIDETDATALSYHIENGNIGEGFSKAKTRVMLLCGGDLLESFATPGLWADEDLETILGEHGIVVISRSGSNPEKFIYESDMLTKYRKNITIITNWVPNEVSSTVIRRLLRRGESVKYLIDDTIISYIKMHKLYGTGEINPNIKYLSPFSFIRPSVATPSPNDVIMKSPSEYRMQKDEKQQKNMNISTKILNYLIGVDEIDNNDVYTSTASYHREKRSRLTSKVSSTNDLTPKVFCGDDDPSSTDSMENLHILPRKSVKVITDVSGVHKIVNNNKKVRENTLDITDDVYVYLNAKIINGEYEKAKMKSAQDRQLSARVDMLKITESELESAESPPASPLRNYDEVVKFIFSEHGIQVISDRETVV